MSVSKNVELRIKGGSVYFFVGLAICIGVILSYEYVWGDFTYKFPLKGLWGALASVLIYYLVQYLFTWVYIRDQSAYRWTRQLDCLWLKSITLKQYRVNKMAPFVLWAICLCSSAFVADIPHCSVADCYIQHLV